MKISGCGGRGAAPGAPLDPPLLNIKYDSKLNWGQNIDWNFGPGFFLLNKKNWTRAFILVKALCYTHSTN